jgi:hypothetical protein
MIQRDSKEVTKMIRWERTRRSQDLPSMVYSLARPSVIKPLSQERIDSLGLFIAFFPSKELQLFE